ncbi:hypothetical protein [Crateriforma conspicua]|uniref:Type II secretion system protein G n=1 Tax=Crateriforma conspicua TaxID=2527996 RepID=A0A5C6FUT8_9PLAN|nr:hypothetical protein [Crateriforma conspicua]TWU65325.1 hypothetical protein V7x_08710 [Crateriforma conspicua]
MKDKRVVAAVVVAAVGVPIAIATWQAWASAAEGARKSAVLALMDEIERTATSHYDEFGSYPSSIGEMSISAFPDGGTPSMLDEIDYTSDGDSMTLEWGEFRMTRPGAEQ